MELEQSSRRAAEGENPKEGCVEEVSLLHRISWLLARSMRNVECGNKQIPHGVDRKGELPNKSSQLPL